MKISFLENNGLVSKLSIEKYVKLTWVNATFCHPFHSHVLNTPLMGIILWKFHFWKTMDRSVNRQCSKIEKSFKLTWVNATFCHPCHSYILDVPLMYIISWNLHFWKMTALPTNEHTSMELLVDWCEMKWNVVDDCKLYSLDTPVMNVIL